MCGLSKHTIIWFIILQIPQISSNKMRCSYRPTEKNVLYVSIHVHVHATNLAMAYRLYTACTPQDYR